MTGFIRRVVTGHDEGGKAVVVSDALTPTLKTNPLRPGHKSTEIWRTHAAPTTIARMERDPTMDGPRTIHPAPRGTSHSWRNLSDKPCRILFVLIDGRFDRELMDAFRQRESDSRPA